MGGHGGDLTRMHPKSRKVTAQLEALEWWDEGRNHMLFELSDAPCLPYRAEHAIVAKCG